MGHVIVSWTEQQTDETDDYLDLSKGNGNWSPELSLIYKDILLNC